VDTQEQTMLARLRTLLAKQGRLTGDLIDAEDGMQKSQTYRKRFGSLMEAYRQVGWGSERRYRVIAIRPLVRHAQQALEKEITNKLGQVADSFLKEEGKPRWCVDGDLSVHAVVVPVSRSQRRRRVWAFYGNRGCDSDILIIARLNSEAAGILDYFVFPGSYTTPIRIFDDNPWPTELHRFPDLGFLDTLCRRTRLELS
jgi:hypothetical protein